MWAKLLTVVIAFNVFTLGFSRSSSRPDEALALATLLGVFVLARKIWRI